MVRYDVFVTGICDGTVLNNVEVKLYTPNQDGHAITTEYQCGSIICDNGYVKWLVTVPPLKVSNAEDEIRCVMWIKSTRKGVEDTFRILKGRWHVLKAGVRCYSVCKKTSLADLL